MAHKESFGNVLPEDFELNWDHEAMERTRKLHEAIQKHNMEIMMEATRIPEDRKISRSSSLDMVRGLMIEERIKGIKEKMELMALERFIIPTKNINLEEGER